MLAEKRIDYEFVVAAPNDAASHVTAYNAAGNLGVVQYELGEVDEARLHLDLSLSLAALTDSDIRALFAYLQSLPPIKNRTPQPIEPTTTEKQ